MGGPCVPGPRPRHDKKRQLSKTAYGGAKAADDALRDLIEKAPRADGLAVSFGHTRQLTPQ